MFQHHLEEHRSTRKPFKEPLQSSFGEIGETVSAWRGEEDREQHLRCGDGNDECSVIQVVFESLYEFC